MVNIIGSVLIPGISLAGHIGGAVGGAFLAIIFPVRGERRMYSTSQRLGAVGVIRRTRSVTFLQGNGVVRAYNNSCVMKKDKAFLNLIFFLFYTQ